MDDVVCEMSVDGSGQERGGRLTGGVWRCVNVGTVQRADGFLWEMPRPRPTYNDQANGSDLGSCRVLDTGCQFEHVGGCCGVGVLMNAVGILKPWRSFALNYSGLHDSLVLEDRRLE